MEGNNFLSIVQSFFQYGPFAILAYLWIFVLPRMYKQMKKESGDLRKILKKQIKFYQIIVAGLIIVCVVFWIYHFLGPKIYYGEIVNINPNEYDIKSPELFMNTYSTAGEYKIHWIWKKEKDNPDAKINFVQGTSSSPVKRFYLYPEALQRGFCRLIYKENDGMLTYLGKNLPIEPHAINLKGEIYFGSGYLFAGEQGIDVEKIISQLQAMDFNVRNQAVEKVVNFMSDAEKRLVVSQGFNYVKKIKQSRTETLNVPYNVGYLLSSLLTIINGISQAGKYQFGDWDKILGSDGFDIIIEAAGGEDTNIKNLSLNFLSKYKKDLFPLIEANMNSPRYQLNSNYLKGGIRFISKMPDQKATLQDFENKPRYKENLELNNLIKASLKAQDMQLAAQSIQTTSGQLKSVIDLALKLKERNINYKWGGKNEKEGFDSAGFIVYFFNQAKLFGKPNYYTAGKIRSEIGERRSDNKPKEIGDLVFYNEGAVMLYLGNGQVIGMTENGIVIKEYQDFRGGPIQINKVNYK